MASIALVRIDSRLIHGQVVTKWLKQTNANRVVVIDDNLARDPFMSKIYMMAAPPGIKVQMMTLDDSVSSWNADQLGGGSVLVLFKDTKSARAAWSKGFPITKLQVGGLTGAPGRKVVFQNITLNREDTDDLVAMQEGGVEVYFQTIPEDTPRTLAAVLRNLKL